MTTLITIQQAVDGFKELIETSIIELIKVIRLILKSNFRIVNRNLNPKTAIRSQANIRKAEKEISWIPMISLGDGLRLTINHLKIYRDN